VAANIPTAVWPGGRPIAGGSCMNQSGSSYCRTVVGANSASQSRVTDLLQVKTERAKIAASFGPRKEDLEMARKTITVSDFSQKEIPDDKQSVQVVLRYADGRRGQVVADAHVDDDVVKQIARVGKQQARRGRRPKGESS
jgi:hypothetical protein